jgi:1-acyl-sn-glycerol-3-phosphate acyltransferase
MCWIILRLYLMICCKLRIHGLWNVPPQGGVIIASNHIGAGDPPFVGTCLNRELFYLAKKELFRNIFLRILIRNLNAIPVNRSILDQKALQASKEALQRGYGLILFPEGTRSRSGELRKGKPGVGLLARKALVPVVPAYIENSRGFAGLLFSNRRLEVTFGEPISREWIESLPENNSGYRAIAEEVMARIQNLSTAARARSAGTLVEQTQKV